MKSRVVKLGCVQTPSCVHKHLENQTHKYTILYLFVKTDVQILANQPRLVSDNLPMWSNAVSVEVERFQIRMYMSPLKYIQIHKYKYANTNTPTCTYQGRVFSVRGQVMEYRSKASVFKPSEVFTNTQIQKHKYTNTAYDEVPERPNMWYIFEKRIQ